MVEEMKVRDGYKKTEVGVIPEDWEVWKLEDYVAIASGESPSKFEFHNKGIPYFKVEQLNNSNKYQNETPYYIDTNKSIPAGSIIFPKRGASILLNKIRILEQDSYMDTNLMTLTSNDKIDNEYLFYKLSFVELWKVADTTSVPQINNKHINPFKISVPNTINEQKEIAKALTDTDNLIHSIEKLINKKEKIKQGTMQELLTGKKRLDGFSENNMNNDCRKSEIGNIPKGWNCTELNSIISNVRLGGNYTNSEEQSPYPLIKMGNLDRSKIKLDKIEYINSKTKPSNLDKLKYGDLLFNTRNTLTLVGKTSIWRNELPLAYYNSNILRLEFKNDYISSSFFMNYILNMQNSIVQLRNFATGTTSVAAIYTKDLMKLKVAIPTNVEEQKAISKILSDMDQEIQGLKEKLEKHKTIKQGMMQELLTGRVRLI